MKFLRRQPWGFWFMNLVLGYSLAHIDLTDKQALTIILISNLMALAWKLHRD